MNYLKTCLLLFMVLPALLSACGGGDVPATGSIEATHDNMKVQVNAEPSPPRVGVLTTLTISALDASSGAPLEGVELRPVVDMYMPTSRMLLPFEVVESGAASQTIQLLPEHQGTLKITVSVKRDGVFTPVRMPDLPIQPAP